MSPKRRRDDLTHYEEPYRAYWRALSPRERLRRAWRLRRRIRDLQKLHDQRLFPRL
ncbi:MAG: hypothetical protein HYY16_07335 [Planctomycetes bacterium]|nr:hypothetical protein [Planctomycetota bacterium]